MVDAPERIWAVTDLGMVGTGRWTTQGAENPFGNVEFVRADLYEQVKRDLAATQEKLIEANNSVIQCNAERLAGSRAVVKPLEWKNNSSNSLWTDEVMFGVYYVAYDQGDGWLVERGQFLSEAGLRKIAFGPKVEVLAAAQDDYERRILSALAEPAGEAGPVAFIYEWKPKGVDNPWQVGISLQDPHERQTREYRNIRPLFTTPPASAIREALETERERCIKAASDYCWQRYKGRPPMNLSSPSVFTSHEHEKIAEYIRAALAGSAE